jgi:hypothetical protein
MAEAVSMSLWELVWEDVWATEAATKSVVRTIAKTRWLNISLVMLEAQYVRNPR